jgi:hypothetical protein
MMGSSKMKAKLIRVRFERVPGNRIMALSNELPGLMVAGGSIEELLTLVPKAIEELFEASGHPVKVSEVESSEPNSFVAVPTARQPELACA